VWIEEVAFKNLVWNLLKNSLDYIDEIGRGEIFIWVTEGAVNDNFNYLNIKDTAKGLYPKSTEKIFESFYTERKGGTGVGLSYCKLLMKAAGGDIVCKGKLNNYAHFIITFPKID
jgi:signal transduction histidine kinase